MPGLVDQLRNADEMAPGGATLAELRHDLQLGGRTVTRADSSMN